MTVADRLTPYYVWFKQGFSEVSQYIGIVNTVLLFIAVLSLRDIIIPLWMAPVAFVLVVIACIVYAYLFEHFGVWSRINSHFNRRQNPELKEILDTVQEIKKKIEERK